jgi:hypothetical protein
VRRMGFLVGLLVAHAHGGEDGGAGNGGVEYGEGAKRTMVRVAETVAAVWALDQKSALLGRSAASRNQQLKRLVEQVSTQEALFTSETRHACVGRQADIPVDVCLSQCPLS